MEKANAMITLKSGGNVEREEKEKKNEKQGCRTTTEVRDEQNKAEKNVKNNTKLR